MRLETVFDGDLNSWPYKHPSMVPNTTQEYYGTDSRILHERNLKNTDNWIYKDKYFTYNFNDQSMRMDKNVEDVDDDYIYFSGTSFAMGIGVDIKDRYSDIIARELNLDYINCAGPTFAIKNQFISFTNLLNSGYKLPKIFVMEYPQSYSYANYTGGKYVWSHSLKKMSDEYPRHKSAYKELVETDFFINETLIMRNNIMGVCKRLGIKYAEICFHDNDMLTDYVPFIDLNTNKEDINYCWARDIRISDGMYTAHPGIGIHQLTSNIILNQL